jgi:predicted membrane-bound spermidine synthase
MTFLTLAAVSAPNLDVSVQVFMMFIPFLVAGTVLAMAYKLFVSQSSILHFADLIGAALGSLAIVFFINWAGAPLAVIFVSTLTLVASALFSLASKKKLILAVSLLAIIGMSVFAQYSSTLWNVQPGNNQTKELSNFLSPSVGGTIESTKWTSFGQVELVSTSVLPHEKVIFVDGGAGTSLYQFNGDFNDSTNSIVPTLRNTTMYFPYTISNKDSSLVIGPGGGVDVLTALMAGVKNIDAVDVNPGIVEIVKEQAAYDGGIYTNYSNVHVTVDDGRSYLKRSDQKYDVIMLDIPLTKTAQGTLGYSLAENYLFTTDSFADYLNHLNDKGYLTIVAHDQVEIYKLVSTAIKVLQNQGLDTAQIMNRIVVIGKEDTMDHNNLPVFILKKTPITVQQATVIDDKAAAIGLSTLYTPLISGNSTDPHLPHLADDQMSIQQLIDIAPYNLNAPSDDSPFFYNFNIGPPSTLIALLGAAIILCIAVSILYVAVRRKDKFVFKGGAKIKSQTKFSGYKWYIFASLGLGFMLIEVALIQKFILFLGEPTLAIAVSLFSLLLAGGLGSLFSKKWVNGKQTNAFKVSLIIAILTISYIFLLPMIFNAALSYSTLIRFVISFVFISPLGFLMGIPFPTALGYIKHEFENDAAWMWCINGAFSVLAGVFALIIAMTIGFNAVLLLGALTYAGLFVIGRRHEQNHTGGKIKWTNPQAHKFMTPSQKGKHVDKRL